MTNKTTSKDKDLLPFTDVEERILARLESKRGRAEERFPFAIALLATFGFVATLYGFEKVIDRIDFFANNPWTLLLTGLVILAITGTVYKKLD